MFLCFLARASCVFRSSVNNERARIDLLNLKISPQLAPVFLLLPVRHDLSSIRKLTFVVLAGALLQPLQTCVRTNDTLKGVHAQIENEAILRGAR